MRIALIVCISALLASCASTSTGTLVLSGETLLISGPIAEKTAAEFKSVLLKSRVTKVQVSSVGGLVRPAIAIADEIRDRNIDVEVIGPCFSSCANYLFVAGKTKIISGRGVVGWHGNMHHLLYLHESGQRTLKGPALDEVKKLVVAENAFFTSVNVDQFICWFGKLPPYSARNLYYLDAADMSHFGIVGLVVRPDYALADATVYDAKGIEKLRYVKVDWESFSRPELAKR